MMCFLGMQARERRACERPHPRHVSRSSRRKIDKLSRGRLQFHRGDRGTRRQSTNSHRGSQVSRILGQAHFSIVSPEKNKRKKCADRVPMSCNSFVTFLTKTNRIMTCVCCSHETVQSTRRHPAHPASVYPSTSSTPMVRLPVDIQHTHSSIARADSSS